MKLSFVARLSCFAFLFLTLVPAELAAASRRIVLPEAGQPPHPGLASPDAAIRGQRHANTARVPPAAAHRQEAMCCARTARSGGGGRS